MDLKTLPGRVVRAVQKKMSERPPIVNPNSERHKREAAYLKRIQDNKNKKRW